MLYCDRCQDEIAVYADMDICEECAAIICKNCLPGCLCEDGKIKTDDRVLQDGVALMDTASIHKAISAIFERNGAGCCLHIAIDDGNVRYTDLECCLQTARKVWHADCGMIAQDLMRRTKADRLKIVRG
jgi:hypothetical protein